MGTNLRDLDLSMFSVFIDPHHTYIIKRIVPWLCIAPFVLTCQQYSNGEQQDHARQIAYTSYNPRNMVARYRIRDPGMSKTLTHLPRLILSPPHERPSSIANAERR